SEQVVRRAEPRDGAGHGRRQMPVLVRAAPRPRPTVVQERLVRVQLEQVGPRGGRRTYVVVDGYQLVRLGEVERETAVPSHPAARRLDDERGEGCRDEGVD